MQGVEFSFGDGDQLDGEVQGGTAGDACLGDSVVTVGQVGRDGQGSSLALAHTGYTLFVALDNLGKWIVGDFRNDLCLSRGDEFCQNDFFPFFARYRKCHCRQIIPLLFI